MAISLASFLHGSTLCPIYMAFSWGNWRGVFGFLPCSDKFPMGFLSSSPSSQVVPQNISNNINSTSILCHMLLPTVQLSWILKRWAIRELIRFYFATEVQRCGSIKECPMTKLWALSNLFLKFEHLLSLNFGISYLIGCCTSWELSNIMLKSKFICFFKLTFE